MPSGALDTRPRGAAMKRSSAIAALIVGAGCAAGLGYWVGRSRPAPAPIVHAPVARSVPTQIADDTAPTPPSVRPRPPPAPIRQLIADAIEQAPVHGIAEVDAYLDSLEARARSQRKVTALEIEPGLAMIQRHSARPDQDIGTFAQRMQRLQRELEGVTEAPRPDRPELKTQLGGLLDQIERPRDDTEKQDRIRQYLALARQLGDEEQAQVLERLNSAVHAARGPVDEHALDALWSAIERAEDAAERQALIADYLELARELPDAESQERLASLNERYGAQGR